MIENAAASRVSVGDGGSAERPCGHEGEDLCDSVNYAMCAR